MRSKQAVQRSAFVMFLDVLGGPKLEPHDALIHFHFWCLICGFIWPERKAATLRDFSV